MHASRALALSLAALTAGCSSESDLVETAGAPSNEPMVDTPAPVPVAKNAHLPAIDRDVLATYGAAADPAGKYETATFALG